jgi:hypothetical protein
MKNITFSADEHLIESARARARAEHSTLNEAFRRWLEDYASVNDRLARYDETMAEVRGHIKLRVKPTREEMNAR